MLVLTPVGVLQSMATLLAWTTDRPMEPDFTSLLEPTLTSKFIKQK